MIEVRDPIVARRIRVCRPMLRWIVRGHRLNGRTVRKRVFNRLPMQIAMRQRFADRSLWR